jgi:hypothetical protein
MAKWKFIGVVVCVLLTFQLNAQRKSFTQSFDKGIVVLDAYTSLARLKSRNSDALSYKMPFFLSAELGVRSDVGLGLLGGWSQRQIKNANATLTTLNNYYYGLKLNIHLIRWINDQAKLRISEHKTDAYVGLWAARNTEEQVELTNPGPVFSGTSTIMGAIAGLKIYSKYNLGLMLEAGFGPYGLINAGICYKF